MLKRYDIINHLVEKYNFQDYLEIGVRKAPACFDKILAPIKTAVDPSFVIKPEDKNAKCYEMTSDDFFAINHNKYDLIFIDGMHVDEFVFRDIKNSLECLNENGYIVLHDCNPKMEYHQRPFEQYEGKGIWNGTVWKAFVRYRSRPDLYMATIDTDYGIGCIRRGTQDPIIIKDEDITWDNFSNNRVSWLNLQRSYGINSTFLTESLECL